MQQELESLWEKALYHTAFRKAVFSRPQNKNEIKMIATLFLHNGQEMLQLESHQKDGKALHQNVPLESAAMVLQKKMMLYRQINLYTQDGEAEIRISDKGKIWYKDRIAATEKKPKMTDHNRKKDYLIDKDDAFPFLFALEIVDKTGRILDKKQAKFRQINRFLEFVLDALEHLPKGETPLQVWDLCCGKSYLTFAVYYYLTVCKKRKVTLYAVDRKTDMIEKCQKLATDLQYTGLHFVCMDIRDFKTDQAPDMVLSLHACDIATDIVLTHAVTQGARVILSAPCCHHEMSGQLQCESLHFLQKHAILKQKFCDVATDGLRALRLEAEGYQVAAVEFIDPDETPKNTLIRAYLSDNVNRYARQAALQEYERTCQYLGVKPYLHKLLTDKN